MNVNHIEAGDRDALEQHRAHMSSELALAHELDHAVG